ncbi:unnamed protein product, partial [Ectocarpus sp. 12 AP-2014]
MNVCLPHSPLSVFTWMSRNVSGCRYRTCAATGISFTAVAARFYNFDHVIVACEVPALWSRPPLSTSLILIRFALLWSYAYPQVAISPPQAEQRHEQAGRRRWRC